MLKIGVDGASGAKRPAAASAATNQGKRIITTKHDGAIGQRVNHKPVPFGQNLLIAARLDALLAHVEEGRAADY